MIKRQSKRILSLATVLAILLSSMLSKAQNAVVGTGFSNGWGGGSCPTGSSNFKYLSSSVGSSYMLTSFANGTGNQYFRFGVDWSGTTKQLAITPGSDVNIVPNTTYNLNTNCTTSGSQVINVPNTSYNYIFKTLNAGTSPTGTFVFFEVQGIVRTINTVTASPATVCASNVVTVSAIASGAFNSGQQAYLRYTTNAFTSSSVVPMLLSAGNTYTATIPAQAAGTNVTYYVFTSGTANVSSNGSNADLYTINLNNNSNANYSYTVNSLVSSNFASVSPICAGETLTALPTTSTNGISGTWSPALNNSSTTTYTFTPSSGQCGSTATLAIVVNPLDIPTFNMISPICAGETLSALPTTSTNGISGTWNPTLDNASTTTYTFTPSSGQCASSTVLTIVVNPMVTPNFNAVAPICGGNPIAPLPLTSTNGIVGTWLPATDNSNSTVYTFTPSSGQCAVSNTLAITVNPYPNLLTVSNNSPICLNANANFTVTATAGATLNYNFNGGLFTSATIGSGGTYVVTQSNVTNTAILNFLSITKNGCTTVLNSNSQVYPSILRIDFTNTEPYCFGEATGNIFADVTGGLEPYTYSWAPGGATTNPLSNITNGIYTLTVTDMGGCTLVLKDTLNAPPQLLTPITLLNQVTCSGGSNGAAYVVPTGGISPYLVDQFWVGPNVLNPFSDTLKDASPGTYVVTAIDFNGCSATSSIEIIEPTNVISAGIAVLQNIDCAGNSNGILDASATGGTAPYTYQWTSGPATKTYSNIPSAIYEVVVKDANNCTASSMIDLSAPSNLGVIISVTSGVTCNGLSNASIKANVIGGTPFSGSTPGINDYFYSWFSPISSTVATATGLSAGTYSLIVTDAKGCTIADSKVVNQPNIYATTVNTVVCNNFTVPGTSIVINSTSSYIHIYNTILGCDSTVTFNITVNSNTGSSSHTFCQGSNFTLPGITNNITSDGIYTVSFTNSKGCDSIHSYNVKGSYALMLAPIVTEPRCYGDYGSVALNPSGGIGTLTINPTTTTNLSPGQYSYSVTDSFGCMLNVAVQIAGPSAPVTISSISTVAPSCSYSYDGIVSATVYGGTGNFYTFKVMSAFAPTIMFNNSFPSFQQGTYTIVAEDMNNCSGTTIVTLTAPPPITVTANIYNASFCTGNDGKITLSGSGGTGSITFDAVYSPALSQNPLGTFNNLSAQVYAVIATDALGCSTLNEYTVSNSPSIVISPTVTPPSCVGKIDGIINILATSGTPNYNYSLTPNAVQNTGGNFVGLAAGAYTATIVDGRGCTATSTVTVNAPNALVFNPTVASSPTCNGSANGSFIKTANGGTGNLTYVITPTKPQPVAGNFINLASGIYQVKVTDSKNCSLSTIIPMAQPNAMTIAMVGKNNVTCNGLANGSYTLNANGGSGLKTFTSLPVSTLNSAGNGFINLAAQTFTVTAKDVFNCTKSTTVVITQPTALTWGAIIINNPIGTNSNGIITSSISGGSGTKIYSLSPASGTQVTAGKFTGLPSGSYIIQATDANSCTATTNATLTQVSLIVNNGNASIPKTKETTALNIYPNPTKGKLVVEYEAGNNAEVTILINDAQGKLIKEEKHTITIGQNVLTLDLTNLVDGLYNLSLISNGAKQNKLILKK